MGKLKMSDEAKALQAAYIKEWRSKNADKVRQHKIDFWERKAMQAASGESIEIRVFKLHEQGFSLREIAAKTGINHVKVSRILKV